MFVDRRLGRTPRQSLTGIDHGFGECDDFGLGHGLEIDCHRKGRHLVIFDGAICVAGNELFDGGGFQFFAVSFGFDNLGNVHVDYVFEMGEK